MLFEGSLHRFGQDGAGDPLPRQPGAREKVRGQVQQGQGVVGRAVAAPVQSDGAPLSRQQGKAGVHPLGGAAGEKEAGVKAQALRPQALRFPDGVWLGSEQVAGGAVFSEVKLRRPGEIPRQGPAMVAGHVQTEGILPRQGPEAVI